MKNQFFAAHMPSNSRVPTDLYLCADTEEFNLLESIEQDIQRMRLTTPYVTVSDMEIGYNRGYQNNSPDFGDTVADILIEKLSGDYKGLEFWDKSLQGKSEEDTMNVEGAGKDLAKKMKITEALRSESEKVTYYFLKEV